MQLSSNQASSNPTKNELRTIPASFSVAPMMEWSTRYQRYMFRIISKQAILYTEMVVDQTIIHQKHNLDKYLGYDQEEHPVVLQLGGSDPDMLAEAVKLAAPYGYDEINLNVGCPSPRVSKCYFGARLMLDPTRVHDIMAKVRQVSSRDTPVTVKCRLGVDEFDSYEYVHDFVKTVKAAGVRHFVIHARKAHLKGLNPTQNRTVPPLKYEWVHRLASDHPDLEFSLNGGLTDLKMIQTELSRINPKTGSYSLCGVMVGRAAYHNPIAFANVDEEVFHVPSGKDKSDPSLTRRAIIHQCLIHFENLYQQDPLHHKPTKMVEPLAYLFHGVPLSSIFRKIISETGMLRCKNPQGPSLIEIFNSKVQNTKKNNISETIRVVLDSNVHIPVESLRSLIPKTTEYDNDVAPSLSPLSKQQQQKQDLPPPLSLKDHLLLAFVTGLTLGVGGVSSSS